MTNVAQSGPSGAPDGGWGWVVVLASFLIHFIADGFVYSFGIFLPELVSVFGSSHALTGFIGGLLPAVTLGVGPLVSALVNMYGCRNVTCAGAIFSCFALVITFWANSIYYILATVGLVLGLGFGLIYVPAIVSVSYYFEKKRALATGFAVCGSGLGTFALAPFTEYLIEEYSWRGAILIHAGLVLNCVVFGLVMRPLAIDKSEQLKSARKERKQLRLSKLLKKAEREEEEGNRLLSVKSASPETENESVSSPTHLIESPFDPSEEDSPADAADNNNDGNEAPSIEKGAMRRKDVLYTGDLQNNEMYNKDRAQYYASVTSLAGPKTKCLGITCSEEISNSLKEVTDFSILKDPIFLLFAISNLFTSIGFNVPFIYMKDQGLDLGYDDETAAFLIAGIGIGNTVGRIVFGLIANVPRFNKLYIYNVGLAFCGLFVFLDPFFTTFPLLLLCAIMFGFFVGAYVTLTPVLLIDLMGLEKLTNAFGMLLLFQGVATLAGAPICGWLKDVTGSYNIPFWLVGVVITFSGIMLFAIPFMRRCLTNREADKVKEEQEKKC